MVVRVLKASLFIFLDIADTLRYLLMGTTELGEEELVEVGLVKIATLVLY